ncbi:hypothetical protein B0H12DRAFT_1144054 [Mycena haematopus]|nr:hypothetical protein B0H12DRAFT_1144054 [Mycena haematopus]
MSWIQGGTIRLKAVGFAPIPWSMTPPTVSPKPAPPISFVTMASSANKGRVAMMGIHPKPAQMGRREFEEKFEKFVEAFLDVPVARKNFLKADIMVHNERLGGGPLRSLGHDDKAPGVCLACEFETFQDPQFNAVFCGEQAREIGFHSLGHSFTADVETLIDVPASSPESEANRKRVVCVLKVPGHMSPVEFNRRARAVDVALAALPATRKNIVKGSLWFQNDNIETHLQAFGRGPAERVYVILVEAETWENMQAYLTDPEVQKCIADGTKDAAWQQDSYRFAADVISKV